ncbi:hypothetical protein V6N13_028391 [Hibiscus sabdariffa]
MVELQSTLVEEGAEPKTTNDIVDEVLGDNSDGAEKGDDASQVNKSPSVGTIQVHEAVMVTKVASQDTNVVRNATYMASYPDRKNKS